MGWDRDGDGIGDKRHYPADIVSYLALRFPAVRLVMAGRMLSRERHYSKALCSTW